jgi:hypothetical protein
VVKNLETASRLNGIPQSSCVVSRAGKISDKTTESAVYTRFDSPLDVPKILPAGTRLETARGIRIVTPAAFAIDVPVLGNVLARAERWLCDTPAASFAGFYVAVIRKR